jgi:hypothetical protein
LLERRLDDVVVIWFPPPQNLVEGAVDHAREAPVELVGDSAVTALHGTDELFVADRCFGGRAAALDGS